MEFSYLSSEENRVSDILPPYLFPFRQFVTFVTSFASAAQYNQIIKETTNTFSFRHFERSPVMKKYVCNVCGYVYDPEIGDPDSGIAPGTAFEAIPDDWVCPICGLGKDVFVAED
mgnify:FL=1